MTPWLPARLILTRAADGTLGGHIECGDAALDIRNWRKVGDVVEFEVDSSWETFVRALCERVKV